MTRHHAWTARSTQRRLRRRHAALRWITAGALVVGGSATVLTVAVSPTEAPAPGPSAPSSVAPTEPRPVSAVSPPASEPAATEPTAAAGTADPPPARVPTREDPLRVWVAGDSMWELAGPALADLVEATGVATVEVDVRYSSGLTRPDFFDWSAEADEVLRQEDPEVVVVLVGANDAQPLVEGDAIHDPGTPGFAAAYGARVEALMTRLAERGRQVVWVGLPVMRPTGYDVRIADLTAVQQAAAERTPGVTFVPTRALFADQDGGYVESLPDAEGVVRALRGGDGIHLSRDGAARLATYVFAHVHLPTDLPTATGPTEEPAP